MISVMTAKWVGDAFGKDGIYPVWIAMRQYPWLAPVDHRDEGQTGAQIMRPVDKLTVIEDGHCSPNDLGESPQIDGITALTASRYTSWHLFVPRIPSSVTRGANGLRDSRPFAKSHW